MAKFGRNYYFLCAGTFLVGLSFYWLVPVIPLHLKNSAAVGDAGIGLIMGVFSAGAVLARVAAGFFLDRYSRLKVALVSLFIMALVSAGHSHVSGVIPFLGVRVLHGFFWGMTATSLYTLASDLIPESARGMGFGIYGSMIILAMAASPSASVSMYRAFSFGPVALMSAGLALAALLALLFAGRGTPARPPGPGPGFSGYLKSFSDLRVAAIGALFFAVSFAFTGVLSFILLHAERSGIREPGLFFTFYAAATVITRPLQGLVYDQKGPAGLITWACAAGIAGFWLISLSSGYPAYCGGAALLGGAIGVLFTCPQAMAMDITAPEARGAANAELSFLSDVGGLAGGAALGAAAAAYGYRGVFALSALLFAAVLVYSRIYALPAYFSWKKGLS